MKTKKLRREVGEERGTLERNNVSSRKECPEKWSEKEEQENKREKSD